MQKGCRLAQGFYFGRAVDAGEVPHVLEARDQKSS
jgi:EAL domain-containing protein (putative c-di-GMP-specific phosphodiesterase class I)